MDELPVRQPDHHDEDAPLAREDSSWFARQLGEEWQAEEPGIYRYVGPTRSLSAPVPPTDDLRDALAPRGRHRPEFDRDEAAAPQEPTGTAVMSHPSHDGGRVRPESP
jgi:hypothetical protein